jgi:ABC-type phosphate transport system substrate-binding protein
LTGALLCASAIVGTGCGPDPGVVGSVRVGGSNALLTFVQQSAAAFTSQHPLARVRVDLTGTDDGYSLLCDGIADAATATRPATPREERACAASDVRFVPLLVGRTAVVAFTARSSRVPGCLSTTDLRALTGATPRPRTTWRGLGDASLPVVVVVLEAGSYTREAFESIVGDLIARLRAAGRVDGVYLDLHGAMVCEHHDDGEGEILRRVREATLPGAPFDLVLLDPPYSLAE